MQHRRAGAVVTLSVVVLALALVVLNVTPAFARQATPAAAAVATPVVAPTADSVPCTNLFGIAIGNACVIVLHAAPDAGPLDMYMDGEIVVAGAALAGLGEFIPVPVGERQLQIVPSGGAVEDALAELTVNLAEGIAYEVAVFGALPDVRAHVLAVDTAPLADGISRFRVAHVASDAPAVDLVDASGTVLVENVAYPDVSGYVEVPAETYELAANIAGSTDLALPLPGTVLASNTVYTVYITGLVEDGSLSAVLVPVLVSPDLAPATPVA